MLGRRCRSCCALWPGCDGAPPPVPRPGCCVQRQGLSRTAASQPPGPGRGAGQPCSRASHDGAQPRDRSDRRSVRAPGRPASLPPQRSDNLPPAGSRCPGSQLSRPPADRAVVPDRAPVPWSARQEEITRAPTAAGPRHAGHMTGPCWHRSLCADGCSRPGGQLEHSGPSPGNLRRGPEPFAATAQSVSAGCRPGTD